MRGSGGMADAPASGAGGGNPMEVQVLSAAPGFSETGIDNLINF